MSVNPNSFAHISGERTIEGHLGHKIADTFKVFFGGKDAIGKNQMGLLDYPLFPVNLLSLGVGAIIMLPLVPLTLDINPVFKIAYGIILLPPLLVATAALLVAGLALLAAKAITAAVLTLATLPILAVTQIVTSIIKYSRENESSDKYTAMKSNHVLYAGRSADDFGSTPPAPSPTNGHYGSPIHTDSATRRNVSQPDDYTADALLMTHGYGF